MTKSSNSRIARTTSRKRIAESALKLAAHGRLVEVEIDGKPVKFWAMTAGAYQNVMAALQTLAK